MNEERMRKLYGNLRDANVGFDRIYEEFALDMQDEEKRKKLHGNLPKINPDFSRTYEEFSEDMGLPIGGAEPQEQKQEQESRQSWIGRKAENLWNATKSGLLTVGKQALKLSNIVGGMPMDEPWTDTSVARQEDQMRVNATPYKERVAAAERVANGEGSERDKELGEGIRLANELDKKQQAAANKARRDVGKDAGFVDLIKSGNIGGAMELGMITALESAPQMLAGHNAAGAVVLGTLSASDEYDRLTKERPDMSDGAKAAQAVFHGAIEQLWEQWGNPLKLGSKAKVGGEITQQIEEWVKKSGKEKLKSAAKGGLEWLKELGDEGMEEVCTDLSNMIFDTLLGAVDENSEGLIKEYQEQAAAAAQDGKELTKGQFAWEKTKGLIDDFLGGAMAGGYMGAGSMAVNKAAGHYAKTHVQDEDGTTRRMNKYEREQMRERAETMNQVVSEIAEKSGLTRKEVLERMDAEREAQRTNGNAVEGNAYGFLNRLNEGLANHGMRQSAQNGWRDVLDSDAKAIDVPVWENGKTKTYRVIVNNLHLNDDGTIDTAQSGDIEIADLGAREYVREDGMRQSVLERLNNALRKEGNNKPQEQQEAPAPQPAAPQGKAKPAGTPRMPKSVRQQAIRIELDGKPVNVRYTVTKAVWNEDGSLNTDESSKVLLFPNDPKGAYGATFGSRTEEAVAALQDALRKQQAERVAAEEQAAQEKAIAEQQEQILPVEGIENVEAVAAQDGETGQSDAPVAESRNSEPAPKPYPVKADGMPDFEQIGTDPEMSVAAARDMGLDENALIDNSVARIDDEIEATRKSKKMSVLEQMARVDALEKEKAHWESMRKTEENAENPTESLGNPIENSNFANEGEQQNNTGGIQGQGSTGSGANVGLGRQGQSVYGGGTQANTPNGGNEMRVEGGSLPDVPVNGQQNDTGRIHTESTGGSNQNVETGQGGDGVLRGTTPANTGVADNTFDTSNLGRSNGGSLSNNAVSGQQNDTGGIQNDTGRGEEIVPTENSTLQETIRTTSGRDGIGQDVELGNATQGRDGKNERSGRIDTNSNQGDNSELSVHQEVLQFPNSANVSERLSQASDRIDKLLAGRGIKHTQQPIKLASAQSFHDAIAQGKVHNTMGWCVDVHDVSDYENCTCLLTEDGQAGIAITPDGDIISLFSIGNGKGVANKLIPLAIAMGGRTADFYITPNSPTSSNGLQNLYARFGAKVVAQTPFAEQYMQYNPEWVAYENGLVEKYKSEGFSEEEAREKAHAEATDHPVGACIFPATAEEAIEFKAQNPQYTVDMDRVEKFEGEDGYEKMMAHRDKELEKEKQQPKTEPKEENGTGDNEVLNLEKDKSIVILTHPIKSHYPLVRVARMSIEDGKTVYREIGSNAVLDTESGFWTPNKKKEVVKNGGVRYLVVEKAGKKRGIPVRSTVWQLAKINRQNVLKVNGKNVTGTRGLVDVRIDRRAQANEAYNKLTDIVGVLTKALVKDPITGKGITLRDILKLRPESFEVQKTDKDGKPLYDENNQPIIEQRVMTVWERIQAKCDEIAQESRKASDEKYNTHSTEKQIKEQSSALQTDLSAAMSKIAGAWNRVCEKNSVDAVIKRQLENIDSKLIDTYRALRKEIYGEERGEIPTAQIPDKKLGKSGGRYTQQDSSIFRYMQVVAEIVQQAETLHEAEVKTLKQKAESKRPTPEEEAVMAIPVPWDLDALAISIPWYATGKSEKERNTNKKSKDKTEEDWLADIDAIDNANDLRKKWIDIKRTALYKDPDNKAFRDRVEDAVDDKAAELGVDIDYLDDNDDASRKPKPKVRTIDDVENDLTTARLALEDAMDEDDFDSVEQLNKRIAELNAEKESIINSQAEMQRGGGVARAVTPVQRFVTNVVMKALGKVKGIAVHRATQDDVKRVLATLGKDVEMQRKRANRSFNQFLQDYIAGKTNVHQIWHANINGVLRYLTNGKELSVRQAVLNKAAKKHNIDLNSLGNLIDKLSDPIAVFKSAREDVNGKVVLIDARDNAGKPIVVAINMDSHQGGMEVNDVTSVYGRENIEDFVRWAEKDLLEDGSREKFEALANSFPENDIRGNLKPALQELAAKIQEKSDIAKQKQIEAQIAYHGTGAKFDRFDHSFMGTGEGAQAYGWGTYVSKRRGVSEGYAEEITRDEVIKLNGEDVNYIIDDSELSEEAQEKLINILTDAAYSNSDRPNRNQAFHNHLSTVLEELKESIANNENAETEQEVADWLGNNLNSLSFPEPKLPQLYTVEIPDDTGSNYLSWNDRVSDEEAKRIGDALYNHLIQSDTEGLYETDAAKQQLRRDIDSQFTSQDGSSIYGNIQDYLGSDKAASLFLNSIGYTGIKVPINNTRGAVAETENDWNYVIFNESDLQIKDRVELMETPDGTVYGWAVGNEIYLTEEGMNPETPIHEYTHLWAKAMENADPKGWAKIVRLCKANKALWESVKNDPNYANIKDDESRIASEVLSRYAGKHGMERLTEEAERMAKEGKSFESDVESKLFVSRIKNALNNLWSWVKNKLGIENLDDISDRSLYDLLNGTDLGLEEMGLTTEEKRIAEQAKADGTYMQAPNGKPSNLSPKQWLQTRTEAFKEWFGDWELANKSVEMVKAAAAHGFANFSEARQWAKDHIVRTFNNEETGGKGDIRISNTAVEKFLSESSVSKSDSRNVHLSVLKVLPDVIRTSIDVEQHADYKKSEDGKRSPENGVNPNVTIHRCYGAVEIDGQVYRVKVTLKSDVTQGDTKKAYSYEATKIELLDGQHGNPVGFPRNSNNSISAAKLLQDVESSKQNGKKILGGQMLLDENGEPKVVYRGSANDDFVFRSRYGEGTYWFTDNREVAEHYARRGADHELTDYELDGRVQPVFLRLGDSSTYNAEGRNWENVYTEPVYQIIDEESGAITAEFKTREEAERYCEENGLDPEIEIYESNGVTGDIAAQQFAGGKTGVVFENVVDGGSVPSNVYVVRDNGQAKSATENNGGFDETNPDIRFQIESGDIGRIDEAMERKMKALSDQYRVAQYDPKVKMPERLGLLNRFVNRVFDRTEGVRILLDRMDDVRQAMGLTKVNRDKYDVRAKLEQSEAAAAGRQKLLDDRQLKDLRVCLHGKRGKGGLAEAVKKSPLYQRYKTEQYIDADGNMKTHELTPEAFIDRYLIARDTIERMEMGIPPRGIAEFVQRMGTDMVTFVREVQDAFSTEQLTELHNCIKAITDVSLDALHDAGMLTEEQYAIYKSRKFYVPEKGFEAQNSEGLARTKWERIKEFVGLGDKDIADTTPRGNGVRPMATSYRARGGDSLATDVLAHIVQDTYDAIEKAELNKVKRAMYDLLRENPEVTRALRLPVPHEVYYVKNEAGEWVRKTDGATAEEKAEARAIMAQVHILEAEIANTTDEQTKNDLYDEIDALLEAMPFADEYTAKNVWQSEQEKRSESVGVWVDGVLQEMRFPNMEQVANALNNKANTQLSLSAVRKVNAFIAGTCTQYNPAFFAVNLVRDVPFILAKGSSEYGYEFAARFGQELVRPTNQIAIAQYIAGNLDESKGGIYQDFYNFITGGGQTGYARSKDLVELRDMIDKWKGWSKLGGFGVGMQEILDIAPKLNEFSELWTRFSAYRAMLDCGYSQEEALKAAKNLSVNFNRRGFGGKLVNMLSSVSMFANATMQGACGFYRTFGGSVAGKKNSKGRRVARVITNFMAIPAIAGALFTLFTPDDDDKEKKIPDWERDNYICIGNWRIPLNEQIKPFFLVGVNAVLLAQGRRTWGQVVSSMAKSITLNLLPVPPTVSQSINLGIESVDGTRDDVRWGTIVRELWMPQGLQNFNALAEGKDFMGRDLRTDYGDVPEFRAAPNEAQMYQDLAYIGYRMGGGRKDMYSTYKKDGDEIDYNRNPKEIKNNIFFTLAPQGWVDIMQTMWGIGHAVATKDKVKESVRSKDIPILNRFYKPTSVEMYRYGIYKQVREELEEYKERISNAKRQAEGGNAAATLEVDKLNAEKEAKDMEMINKVMNIYNTINTYQQAKQFGMNEKELKKILPEGIEGTDEERKACIQVMRQWLINTKGVRAMVDDEGKIVVRVK